MLRRPFPLLSGDTGTAGRDMGALGFRLGEIRLPAGARVGVYGPGLGNLTIALARLGYAVSVIDPDPTACAFVAAQAARRGVAVSTGGGPFDAAVIEEGEVERLLPELRQTVANGPVYVMRDPAADGPFRSALLAAGWVGRRRHSVDVPWAPVWELSRWPRPVQRFAAQDGWLGTIVGVKAIVPGGAVIRVSDAAAGCLVLGPHVPLPPGRYLGVYSFEGPVAGLTMDACMDRGATVLARQAVPAGAERGELNFELAGFADEVEVRLFCDAGGSGVVVGLEIQALG